MSLSPNPDVAPRDGQKVVESIGVVSQDVIQTAQLKIEIYGSEAEVEHARVRLPMLEDKLAEVPVERDEDALLRHGDGQNRRVLESGRVVSGNK